MKSRIKNNTAAGIKGGFGGLAGYIWYYFNEVIQWDINAIFQPDNLETLITWSLGFFGVTGTIASWNRDQPAVNTAPTVIPSIPKPVSPVIPGAKVKQYIFSNRSLTYLSTVHPDLQLLATVALQESPYDFGVVSGKRNLAEQKELVKAGASEIVNSRHLHGLAIDIVAYDENNKYTEEHKYYKAIEKVAFRRAAVKTGIPYEWGGDWVTLVDGPHFQLPKVLYPDNPDIVLA